MISAFFGRSDAGAAGSQQAKRAICRPLRMDEAPARHDDPAHLAQILSALHEGLSEHRIRFLKRTGVAHHGGLHGHGGDRVIKHLQLRIVLRQCLRIVRKQLHERLHPLRRKPAAASTPSME